MKLTPRFTLAFILYATALLLVVGSLAYTSGRNTLHDNTIAELEGTAQRKEDNLNRWVDNELSDLRALATDPVLLSNVSTLMTASREAAEFHSAHDKFIASLQPRLAPSAFLEVSLLRPDDGQVIASTTASEEGQVKADQPYLTNGLSVPYVDNPTYSPGQKSFVMTAFSPLLTADGDLLGILAARLDLASLNAVIARRTNLHQTDDAYLVDTSNLFVAQPRLIDDRSILQTGIHSEDVNRCLQQQTGVVQAADFRGVPAFMAYRWIADRQLCLVVKIDQAEAYHPIRVFGETILLISILGLLVAVGIALALGRSLTRPIVALQDGVARFSNGELNQRLDESSPDELGQLAAEFNKMAEVLSEQQTHLRRRAERFFNLTIDLLCTINPSGRLLDLNPAWELTLGYTTEELRGHLITSLIHPDDLTLTTSTLQQVSSEAPGRFEVRFRHKDGRYLWLAWVVAGSPEDQVLYAAARDVTERRLAEEKLRKQAGELERSNQELEQFGYVASHDLQEPLRLVTGYVQLLARRYQGQLDEDADEFIGYTLEGTERMRNLLADLLAYSQIGTSSRNFSPVALEEALKRVTDNLHIVIEANNAVITHEPLPSVLGDDTQMMQLLQNLISNAIKFRGKEPPRIHIGVGQLDDRWLIFVRDNGIGIDPKFTEKVFVIFQRLHTANQYPGTGIGLAIARKIVERHGGRIWVDSESGKGATFYFTLQPLPPATPEAAPAPTTRPRSKDTVSDRATDLI
jgi:PAS domain S-box-containing protein